MTSKFPPFFSKNRKERDLDEGNCREEMIVVYVQNIRKKCMENCSFRWEETRVGFAITVGEMHGPE